MALDRVVPRDRIPRFEPTPAHASVAGRASTSATVGVPGTWRSEAAPRTAGVADRSQVGSELANVERAAQFSRRVPLAVGTARSRASSQDRRGAPSQDELSLHTGRVKRQNRGSERFNSRICGHFRVAKSSNRGGRDAGLGLDTDHRAARAPAHGRHLRAPLVASRDGGSQVSGSSTERAPSSGGWRTSG